MGRARNRIRASLCGAAMLTLLVASAADAKTKTVRGGVVGDADARVIVKMEINRKGAPIRVKRFQVLNLDHACTDGLVREYSLTYGGKLKIRKLGLTSRYTFFGIHQTPSGRPSPNSLFVTGKLRRKATKVTGEISSSIRFPSSQPSGETFCGGGPGPATATGNVRYAARR